METSSAIMPQLTEPVVLVSQAPVITYDLSKLKKELAQLGAWYDSLVITSEADTSFVKEKATELNKIVKKLNEIRLNIKKEVSQPINAFDREMNTMIKEIEDSRKNFLVQVKKREQETLAKIEKLLLKEIASAYQLYHVDNEFQTAGIDDLVLLGNITQKGGNLKAKTIKAISQRVIACKETQDAIKTRLSELSGKCYESGLKTPLQEHNVRHFLYAENYDKQLNALIKMELDRQFKAEQHIKKQLEEKKKLEDLLNQESQAKTEESDKKAIEEETKKTNTSKPLACRADISKPANAASYGEGFYEIAVTMRISKKEMPAGITPERLKAATLKKFFTCGFKSISDIQVIERQGKTTVETNSGLRLAEGSSF